MFSGIFYFTPSNRIMKKLIRLLAGLSLLLVTIISCNKSKDSEELLPGVYLKLNGEQQAYTQNAVVARNSFNGVYSLNFGASNQDTQGNILEGTGFALTSEAEDFAAGKTYSAAAPTANGKGSFELHPKTSDNMDRFWVAAPGTDGQVNLKITITEITSEFVKGTFSGNLFSYPDGLTMGKVTEGKFYVKFLN